jgi:hypothetical protein
MFRNVMLGFAGFALACAPLMATDKQDSDQSGKYLLAAGGSNCPVYYGCPAPAPAPKGGGNSGGGNSGGSKSVDPSKAPALRA